LDIYFHGDHEEFLTLVFDNMYVGNHSHIRFLELEFATFTSSECQRTSRNSREIEVDYSKIVAHRFYDQQNQHDRASNFQGNQRQQLTNQRIESTEMKVEFSEGIALYDISRPGHTSIEMFRYQETKNLSVYSPFAFTTNAKYFAYLDSWEDGDGREEPDLNILRTYTWKQSHWTRRCHIMMFLAGYGLLTIFQKSLQDSHTINASYSKIPMYDEMFVATESSAVQSLFRVFQCPNVLQLIVFYL
jgi:hypothetical protein